MGLAVLRVAGSATGRIPERSDRLSLRFGLIFSAVAAAAAAPTALAFWALWPAGADHAPPALGLGLVVPAVVLAALAAGMVLGRRLERRPTWEAPEAVVPSAEAADSALPARLRQAEQSLAEVKVRAEALVANMEEVAQMGRAERDLLSRHAVWSKVFHDILGLEPGHCEPTPETFLQVVHPGDRPEMAEILRSVMEDGISREADFRIVRPDGEVRMVHGLARVSLDEQGRPARMESYIQDITERKRLENELDGLIRELWRSNEELEQFAYVASHDLRQPLRVVGSYVSLLEEELVGSLGGDALDYMGFVRDGVRRMDRLITDLLTYSRVGRVTDEAPFSADDAMHSALGDLQIEIEETEARVTLPPELPTLYGDRGEMERLFLNLIGNALKYRRPEQSPDVTVECEDAGEMWLFRIRDNGIGIPPQYAERVFGIFQRLHARDEYEGTGVGLAIVKKIIERHGGTIRVEPSEGPGTVVAFTWPKGPRRVESVET